MTKKNYNPTVKNKIYFRKVLFTALGFGAAIAGTLLMMVVITYPKLPSMNDLHNYQPKLPLQVYSADGVILGQFGTERRIFISINHTPKMLINSIIASEDERFYKHGGIDYIGIARAAITNAASGHIKSGGSTITMQVARNFFLGSQKTFMRKFNEALLSYKIESSLTKNQILELYINQIFLGQRSYGFAEAAITYFGKSLDKLSIAEYAMLAGLPKAPSSFNPVVNRSRARDRQLYVLGRMRDLNFINEKEYDAAVNQKIIITKGTLNDSTDSGGYIAEMIRQMLYSRFGESIYTHGYKVYTTIDSKMQQAAYSSLRNGLLNYDTLHGYHGAEDLLDIGDAPANDKITDQIIASAFNELVDYGDLQAAIVLHANLNSVLVKLRNGNLIEFKGTQLDFIKKYLTTGGKLQIKRGSVIRVRSVNSNWIITQVPEVEGALVALNPNDGAIKALVGGFDFTDSQFNHVTAMRQPGSSFKPFIYSSAIDKGITADTIFNDSPICFPGGINGQWCPRNDDDKFLGPITMRQGMAKSRNVVTVKVLEQVTTKYAIDYVTKFGFDKNQFQPYLTMALGANEVTPLQVARAYSVFANGGYIVEPYLIQAITDNRGQLIAKTAVIDIRKESPVIDPRNAFIMNSILQDAIRYGTGARAYRELKRNDIAGKTGTTTDAKDVWFDGYTPDLVAVTWVGYDTPKSLGEKTYGATLALPIWISFMQSALANIPERQLVMPGGIKVKPNSTWQGNDEYYIYGDRDSITNTVSNETLGESITSEVINDTKEDNANKTKLENSNELIQISPSTTEIKKVKEPTREEVNSIFNNTAPAKAAPKQLESTSIQHTSKPIELQPINSSAGKNMDEVISNIKN